MFLFLFATQAVAQVPGDSSRHPLFVVFSDRPIGDEQWSSIFSALRTGITRGGDETQSLDPHAQFMRGDDAYAQSLPHSTITVFLHGNCDLQPMTHRTAFGVPLGWVRRENGQIEPFVHVDCTRVAQVIGAETRWLSRQSRSEVMAEAIARVILHEWIHVATQNPDHTDHGLAKAQFGVSDLIGDSHCAPWVRGGR